MVARSSTQVDAVGMSRQLADVPYYGPPKPVTSTPKPIEPYYGPSKPNVPVTTTPKPAEPKSTTPPPTPPVTTTPKPDERRSTTPPPTPPVTTTPKPDDRKSTTPPPTPPVTTTPKPDEPRSTTPPPIPPDTTTPPPVVNTTATPPQDPTSTTPVPSTITPEPTTASPPVNPSSTTESRTTATTSQPPAEPSTAAPGPTATAPESTTVPPQPTVPAAIPPTESPNTTRPVSTAAAVSNTTASPTTTPPTPMAPTTAAPPPTEIQTLRPPAAAAPSTADASSANNRANSSSSTSDENTVIFMISGVAICVGVVLVVALLIMYRRRRERRGPALPLTPGDDSDAYTGSRYRTANGTFHGELEGSSSMVIRTLPKDFRNDPILQSVRLPLDQLFIGSFLSRGAFGEVLAAMYQGETVVVKRLIPERRKDLTEARIFAQEIQLLATLRHPRIVRLIGAAWDAPATLCAVSEFMDGGDLRGFLTKRAALGLPAGFDASKVKIALHVAEALEYLHTRSPTIIHRDLKSKNVVLLKAGDAKLTDFGVSRARCESTMTSAVGSSLWMAPEVITGGRYDEKADIFSFGVLLAELDTHMLPYRYGPNANKNLSEVALLHKVQSGALTVSFSGHGDDIMTITGRSCVALNPRDRPTAAELKRRLTAILGL